VLRTGRPELVGNVDPAFLGAIARNEEHAKIHRELRPASAIMAPLIARERTVGALVLASPVAGRYGGSDLDVAEDLAARVALAVDNARLFQAEGRAREEALVSLEQTQQLHSVATALGQALTRSAVAEVMVVQACSALQAERATIAELVDEGRTFEILAFRGYPEDLMARWGRFSAEVPSPMADAVKLRQPVIVDSHQELVSRWPELADPDRPSAGQANVTVPLVLDSRVLGALSIGFRESRQLEMSDLAFIGTLGRQCALALERARLLEAEQTARREAETVAARLMLVSRTSELLAVSLDYPATFVRLAKLMVESLADLCLIDVRQDEGTISRVAAVHANPEQQALADVLRERYAPSPNGAHPVAIVMETGEPQYSPEMSEEFLRATTYDEEHFRIVAALGFQSFMCLPLAARGRILGAITFVSTNPERRYSEGDLNAAREIARRAAVRIDNARLFQAEQRARVEAETAQGRLQFLAEASRILSSSLDYDLTLSRVTSLVVPRMADWCNVQLVDEAGQIRTLALAHADPEKVELARQLQAEYPPDPDAPTGTPHVIRTGKSELSREIPDALLAELIRDPRLLEIVRGLGLRSSMVVPLAARGRVFGAIAFIAAESGRLYDAQDLELAEELGRRAGVAIDNARLYRERDYVAQTLQRSLLPPRLPDIRGVELEARYYPLLAASEVGGDFYDVFELGAGAWTLAIGDVCGKGPDAAAVMAVARYTLRAAAMHEGRPSGVLRRINQVLLGPVSDQRFCTACCARLRLDEGRGRLTICSGGHPLPILVRANGEATTVGKAGTLLGVLSDLSLTDVAVDLAAGDALVLYTDGLLDERHGGASGGETKLIAVLAEHAGQEARRMAQALDEYLVRTHGDSPRDDAAFLIARVTP